MRKVLIHTLIFSPDGVSTAYRYNDIALAFQKAHIWHLSKGLMNKMAQVGGWLHLPLNPLRMRKLTENYVASNAKIRSALGIDRFPVDARKGLRRTIKYFAEGK